MRLAPRILGAPRPDRLLGLSVNHVRDADLIAQRAAQDDEAVVDEGVHEPRARTSSLATLAVASIERAVVLGRTQRSTKPLEQVADELAANRRRNVR